MSPIKNFNLMYDSLNKEDTVSQGDTVTGTVTFTLKRDTKVKSVLVKIKGDADVCWREGTGDNRKSYHDHRRYFKDKEYFVAENAKGTVLSCGDHCFKFKFKIPQRNMPSSFNGIHGRITYMIQAKISRSWHLPSTVQKELNFVSKSRLLHGQVMCPQSGSVVKEIGNGQVQMSATINRNVCSPGDTLSVFAKICNSSSKNMRPKISLEQRTVYHAHSATKISNQIFCKNVWEDLKQSEETVSCQLMIPVDLVPTLRDCEIITVDYYVKVYLDISFAIDPEVKLPLVIVPSNFAALHPGEALGPYPAGAVGGPSYSDFPPPAFPPPAFPLPAFPLAPYPVPAGPSAYGYPAPDPAQHANTTSGYNNQWPQQAPPYGFPSAPFPPSTVQHQAPVAPPLSQQEEPPAYTSIFPPPQASFSGPGSDEKVSFNKNTS